MQRIIESMEQRRLPLEHVDKIQSFAANSNAPFLGLTEAEYDGIRKEVTDVIHVYYPFGFFSAIDAQDDSCLERLACQLYSRRGVLRRARWGRTQPHESLPRFTILRARLFLLQLIYQLPSRCARANLC